MSQYAVNSAEEVGRGVGTGVGATGVGAGVGTGVGAGVGAGVGSGVGTMTQAYWAKKPYTQSSMVTLFQYPDPCMLLKSARPLLQTDVLTEIWDGHTRGLPLLHQSMLLSSP
jgi:hypothetical protein